MANASTFGPQAFTPLTDEEFNRSRNIQEFHVGTVDATGGVRIFGSFVLKGHAAAFRDGVTDGSEHVYVWQRLRYDGELMEISI